MIPTTLGCLMFFKAVVSIVISFSLMSCSNDHKFDETDPVVSLSFDSGCLDGLDRAIDLYIDQQLSSEGITSNFSCVREAIDYIQIRVKGEAKGKYTNREVKNFLNKFMFSDDEKTEEFYSVLLDLKSQVFGGEKNEITFSELKTLKVFLEEGERLALLMKPFASALFFEKPFSNEVDVNLVMRPFMRFLERWLTFEDDSLNISTIFDFLKEAEVEVKAQKSWVSILNLMRSTHADAALVLNEDKIKLVSAVEIYYSRFLKLYREIEGEWEYNREAFFRLSAEVDAVLLELQSTILSHPNKKWKVPDLKNFMNLISEYEVLSEPLSGEVQEHVVKVLFGKWFESSDSQVSLNNENTQELIQSWSEINKFILESKDLEGYKGKTFPFVKEGTDSFAQFTQRRWPSLVRKNRTILVTDYEPEVEFTFQSIFHAGWQFLAAKILVKSYTDGLYVDDLTAGMTIDQVKEAYLDVFVFLKEVGFLGEESRGGWFRIFNEGNLFVPSALADGFVSFSETADYAAYMFSAYFVGRNTVDYIEAECPKFSESCTFDYVLKKPVQIFESMPGLWDYFTPDLRDKTFNRWAKGFEYVAKLANDETAYESSEWFRGSVANQYTETIFRKYDVDFSDTLSFAEVSVAYTDFKEALKLLPMVRGTASENNDAQLKSVLTYFVKTGKAPQLRNGRPRGPLILHVANCGGVYTNEKEVCNFESERSKIMSLLAYLTSLTF